ncbi:Gag-Pro-Pol polyprotein [Bienertia sinuspersici]
MQKVKIKMRGVHEEFFDVKYEKPLLFCFCCGHMGHGSKDCDDHKEEVDECVKFGSWLKASPWKQALSKKEEHDKFGEEGSCAKALFITNPQAQNKKNMRIPHKLKRWLVY